MPLDANIDTVQELFRARTGGLNDSFRRTYRRLFRVVTLREDVGPIVVIFAPGIPRVGDIYTNHGGTETDPLAICREATPTQSDSDPLVWEVEVFYSTSEPANIGSSGDAPGRPGGGGGSDNPETLPPLLEWDVEIMQLPARRDLNNVLVVNSAGDPFDPLPTFAVPVPVLKVQVLRLSYDAEDLALIANALNSQPFMGYAAKRVQLAPIPARQEKYGPGIIWRWYLTFKFWVWDVRDWEEIGSLLDAGYYQKPPIGAAGNNRPIMDSFNRPVSKPYPLDEGLPITRADLITFGPNYLKFKLFPYYDFNGLGLGL